jgi:hypothetical protein
MGFRSWVRRLERAARGDMIEIPQKGGEVARFPESAAAEAYLSAYALALGQNVEAHPMLDAMRNSSDPQWASMWADLLTDDADTGGEVEDLSE